MNTYLRDAIWLKLASVERLSADEIVARYQGEPKPTEAEVIDGIRRAIVRSNTTH